MPMSVVEGIFRDYGGQVYNVMNSEFGAVGDGSTDDRQAIQDAIDLAENGDVVYFPGGRIFRIEGMLDLAGKTGVTLLGGQNGAIDGQSGIYLYPASGGGTIAALSLVSARYITLENLSFWISNTTGVARCGVIMGRSDADSYGNHRLERLVVQGYASKALLYNVASEENSFISCRFELWGGGAADTVYFSGEDYLGVATSEFPLHTSSCLSNWMYGCEFFYLPATNADSAAFHIAGIQGVGDLYLIGGFSGIGSGSAFHIEARSSGQNAMEQIVIEDFRVESSSGGLYGLRLSGPSGSRVHGLTVRRLHTAQFSASGARVIKGETGVTVYDAVFEGNRGVLLNTGTGMFDPIGSVIDAADGLAAMDYAGSNPVTINNVTSTTFRPFYGNLAVNGGPSASGNLAVAGSESVAGNVTVAGTETVTGLVTANSGVVIGGGSITNPGSITRDSLNGMYITGYAGTQSQWNVLTSATTRVMAATGAPNLGIFGIPIPGNGVRVVYLANATTIPNANPTGGGIIYVDNGALKYRGPGGTVTTIAPS